MDILVKIVAIEGDSVIVKYASQNSKLNIDDYPSVAYQPLQMGYTNLDDFMNGIKPSLLKQVEERDALEVLMENNPLDKWKDFQFSFRSDEVQQVSTEPRLIEPSDNPDAEVIL